MIGILFVVLLLAIYVSIKVNPNNKNPLATNENGNGVEAENDEIELSLNEITSQATHIVDAKYVGEYQSEYGNELMFKPVKLLKGEINTNDEKTIYVQPESEQDVVVYKENEMYMLFLEKNSSVYYEHDKYVQINNIKVSANDHNWDPYHDQAQTILDKHSDTVPSSYGSEYTHSTNINDILEVSENIFVVKIKDVYSKSNIAPTTVYQSSVIKTIRNTPSDSGNILITLFNDTVNIGDEYVVLLADATDSAPVYTLSSKNSVYTLEEAQAIPELEMLLNDATEF